MFTIFLGKATFSISNTEPNPVKTPQIWLQYPDGDPKVAEREIDSDEPVYHTICFLCQGAALARRRANLEQQRQKLLAKVLELLDHQGPEFGVKQAYLLVLWSSPVSLVQIQI